MNIKLSLHRYAPIIIIILFSGILNFTAAQNNGVLRGFVTDSTSGQTLSFCNVFIKGINRGAATNTKGYYLITAIPGNHMYNVVVSYVGYDSKTFTIYISDRHSTLLNVQLTPSPISLPEVEALGNRYQTGNSTAISLSRISSRQLEALPKGVEADVFKSLQYQAGVQTVGDVSAKFYVRGGSNDQNLILLDGAELYSPFHALGLFSVVDPDIISDVEFYKGGFPADYGGRLSSVVRIITKDGNKNYYDAKGSLSFMSAKALVEGPLLGGSFYLAGRKSISNAILKKFLNDKQLPINFYDLAFKLNYKNDEYIKDGMLTLHGFFSGDKIVNSDVLNSNYDWYNNVLGIRYFQVSDSPLFYEFNLFLSTFKGGIAPNFSNVRPQNNELNDFTMKYDFTYVYHSGDELQTGVMLKDLKNKLVLANAYGVFSDVGSHGLIFSAYGKYKLLRFEKFGADAGTRVTLFKLSDSGEARIKLEPRVNLSYVLSPAVTLHAAWGIYKQALSTLSDENNVISVFDPWILTPDNLDVSSSTQYIFGIKMNPYDRITLNTEGYYKLFSNLPVLNEKKYFPTDPDVVAGTGKAYGVDVNLNYRTHALNLTADYSLAWAFKNADGVQYVPKYDARHTVNLLCEYDLGNGWHASAAWSFHTGLPFTQILGYYDKYDFNSELNQWSIYESYSPYTILGNTNTGRLPDYHRLDLSLGKTFILFKRKVSLDISVLNVYNRANIFYFDRSTGQRVNMLPILPTATLKLEI